MVLQPRATLRASPILHHVVPRVFKYIANSIETHDVHFDINTPSKLTEIVSVIGM